MDRKEILLTGAGGQGILFFGRVLGTAAIQKGKRVVSTPSYGAAVRGDVVQCGVIISDQEIHDPVVDDADIVVALNKGSLQRFGSHVKEGGTVICKGSEGTSAFIGSIDKRFQLISVPLDDLGNELGTKRYHNMIAMGAYLQVDPGLDIDLIREALIKNLKKRGNESLIKENLDAIQAGIDWYRRSKGQSNVQW